MKGFNRFMQHRTPVLRRWAVLGPLAGFSALVAAGWLLAGGLGAADTMTGRISFQIVTGLTGGAYFPVGEAIAGLISHPAGVDRCSKPGVCGPAGLIITARTSPGALENLVAVNSGDVESGLARSDVVAAAVKGEGQFRTSGKAAHVRVIASLFSEQVHLIVSTRSKIKNVAGLKGKHVALGAAGSGLHLTTMEILSAYGVSEASVKPVNATLLDAPALMAAGKLDAIFAVGGIPVEQVTALLSSGKARLVAIDGPDRDRLLKTTPALSRASIPANAYPAQGAVETVSARALWIVRDTVPDSVVYGITKALFNPANREGLADSHPSAREIGLATAALNLPAPLHPGAARFYKEAGVLK